MSLSPRVLGKLLSHNSEKGKRVLFANETIIIVTSVTVSLKVHHLLTHRPPEDTNPYFFLLVKPLSSISGHQIISQQAFHVEVW